MSKFNSVVSNSTKTKSYENGTVYTKDPVEDFINFIFSSKLENTFYEKSDDQLTRFVSLIDKVYNKYGAAFLGKVAAFTRNELGNRSASQVVAAYLNDKHFGRKRDFYKAFCHRPDDVSEIFAFLDMNGQKRSHALVRGCGDYLSSLGDYQLGKYKMNGKKYNMYDLINICHANSDTIDKYKNGTLENPDTWEVAISTSFSPKDKDEQWKRLVEDNSLGYLALIRNLNNILDANVDNEWIKKYLVPQIMNEVAIKKSLVYPYQIYIAYKNLKIANANVVIALDDAFRIACGNMKPLEGKSVVILDVSGSMKSPSSTNSYITCVEIGAVYAAALYINGACDFVKFGTEAKSKHFKNAYGPFQLIKEMCKNDNCGYSTNIASAFNEIAGHDYQRIFLVSDMQVMDNSLYWYGRCDNGVDNYNSYVKNVEHPVQLYSFDVSNYATQIVPSGNSDMHLLTTMSDKIFDMIPFIEDGGDMVDYINSHYSF